MFKKDEVKLSHSMEVLKISLSSGWLSMKVPFPRWYCVTKGSMFFSAVLFFCASDIFQSQNSISERWFSTILAG